MALNNDAVIIAGMLDDSELRRSIEALVSAVNNNTKTMAESFDSAITRMVNSLKDLRTASDQSTSGNTQRASSNQKEVKSVQDLSNSYDALAKSLQQAAAQSVRRFDVSEIQSLRMQAHELEALISIAEKRKPTILSSIKQEADELAVTLQRLSQKKEAIQSKGILSPSEANNVKYIEQEIQRLSQRYTQLSEQFRKTDKVEDLRKAYGEVQEKIRQVGQAMIDADNAEKQATQSASKHATETERLAKAIRESKEWQEKGFATVGDNVYYDPERSIMPLKQRKSLEQQILDVQKKQEENARRQEIEEQKSLAQKQAAAQAAQQQLAVEQQVTQEQAKQTTKPKTFGDYDDLRAAIARVLGMREKELQMANTETASYNRLNNTLRLLKEAYDRLGAADRNSDNGRALAASIREVEHALQRIKQQASRPINVAEITGLSEKSLDEIRYKLQMLERYRSGLNIKTQKNEINDTTAQIERLRKKQEEIIGTTRRWTENNNAVTRSLNYMKNRLAFYFTVGASTQFVNNLIEIRSQYEMTERALGILVQSAERGSQIFKELSDMALVSPYTLIELSNAAKQLVAYDVAAKDVVDTTRRLADMSAAVGVPIDRLTYALGQIKAYGYLNARDARMFANAGIPLVKELADYYTQLEGKLVSVSEIYDRIKKKAIGYNEVMAVITSMTDESGRFFDFQAKMADTLKVQLANLTLAWNNMLNEIGGSQQGVLTGFIKTLKQLFLHWKDLNSIIWNLIYTFGVFRGVQMLSVMFTKTQVAPALIGAAKNVATLRNALNSLSKTMTAMATSWWTWIFLVISAGASAIQHWNNVKKANRELNESIQKDAEESAKSISKFLGEDAVSKAYTAAMSGTLSDVDARKTWGALRDEIEKSSQASDVFIAQLLQEEDLNKRVTKAYEVAEKIRDANNALSQLNNELEISQDSWGWGLFGEGLAEDLEDYTEALEEAHKFAVEYNLGDVFLSESEHGNVKEAQKEIRKFAEEAQRVIREKLGEEGVKDATKVTESIARLVNEVEKANPKIRGAGKLMFETMIDDLMSDSFGKEIYDKNTTLYKKLFEQIRKDSGSLFVDLDDRFLAENKRWDEERENAIRRAGDKLKRDLPQASRDAVDEIISFLDTQEFRVKIVAQLGGGDRSEFQKDWDETIGDLGVVVAETLKTFRPDKEASFKGYFDELRSERKKLVEENKAYARTDSDYAKTQLAWGKERVENIDKIFAAYNQLKEEESSGGGKKDVLGDALTKEVQLISDIQKRYKEYKQMGVDAQNALTLASNEYNKSLATQNRILSKLGINTLTSEQLANMPMQDIRDFYQGQLKMASALQNTKGVEALEKAIAGLNVEITKLDYKRITDGLNNELSKLKDEYELSVELDANPELGNMFSQMFGIDTDALPRTFGEAFDRANAIAIAKLKELKIYIDDFDIMSSLIKGDDNNQWMGLDMGSDVVKGLLKWQDTFRDMFKKNLTETEKMLDDYVQKYGNVSDKIATIEADRLEKLKKLDNAYYTDAMRATSEYAAKRDAIEKGATREKGAAMFEEFKNSNLYIEMFENLRYASTSTLEAMRAKLVDLKGEMGTLSPEQLKQVTQQFEKIDNELLRRNPFKNLIKNAKEYSKALLRDGRNAQKSFRDAQSAYDEQLKVVIAKKEELEQKKAQQPLDKEGLNALQEQVRIEDEKLKKLYEELLIAEELNNQYNLMRRTFGEQAQAIGKLLQVVASNLQSLGELRDTLHDMFGVDLGNELNAVIDDLNMVGEGLSKVVSSAQSGDVVGVVTGAIKTVSGVGDAIASVFGDGAARTRKINKEIERSENQVYQLERAYEALERTVEKAMGAEELRARRSQIANKQAQLAEMERQLQLEKSKRSKDRDDDKLREYEETIADLRNEVQGLAESITTTLLGADIKSAAEDFVSTWVDAWRKGDDVMSALDDKFDDMIDNMIMKSLASRLVAKRLEPIWNMVDEMTSDQSQGGTSVTLEELRRLQALIGNRSITEGINEDLTNLYNALGIMYGSGGDTQKSVSALQQGIQGITEDTAGALEAYWNANTQQQYIHTDLLTQIRDAVVLYNDDVNIATSSQILLQLQQSFQVQMAIQAILLGWSNASGMAMRVEII